MRPAVLHEKKESFRTLDWLALSASFLLIAVLLWLLRNSLIDDSFIYLNVAKNIIHGNGWVFNPGERVNPCTSPLFTLLLVFFGFFFQASEFTLPFTYGLGLLAMAWIQYTALRDWGRAAAFVVSIVSVSEPFLFRSFGMETSIFLASVMAAAWSYQQGRWILCGLFAGLAALGRPEGMALIVILSVLHTVHRREILKKSLLAFAAVVIPWLLFSYVYFGTTVPNSVASKAQQIPMFTTLFHDTWGTVLLQHMSIMPLTILVALTGVVLAVRRSFQASSYAAIVILFGFVQMAGYTVLHAPIFFLWYFAPANLAINMAVAIALFWIFDRISEAVSGTAVVRVRQTLVSVLVLLLVSRFGAAPFALPQPFESREAYINIGKWLQQHSTSHERIATTEIGYLGYYSERPILDIYGLIHPEAMRFVVKWHLTWWFESDTLPEFIIARQHPFPGEPLPSWGPLWTKFLRNYHLAFRSGAILLFRRSDAPPETPAL